MLQKHSCLAILLAALIPTGHAATVIFNSPVTTGAFSTATPWPTDGTFFFEVGTFDAGFMPGTGNTDLWLSHWNVADMGASGSTTWLDDDGDLYFTGIGDYTTNSDSWAIGSPLYVWGFDTRAPGSNEWILFANTAWVTIDHTTVAPQFLSTEDAGSLTIVGSMDAGGGDFVSAEIIVVPEPSTLSLLIGLSAAVLLKRRHHNRL